MSIILFIAFIGAGTIGAFAAKKLTLPASITGGLIGTLLYFGVGWIGVVLIGTFFLLGTLVTSWKKKTKAALHIAQENGGRRNIGQVIANGGVGGLLGLMGTVMPEQTSLVIFLIACAFSSATADTVSSELGSVYGKRFYDVISFKRGQRGLDGIVSFEGLFFGIMGSSFIALLYALSEGWNADFLWIVVAGTIGNLADSYLGATLERKEVIGNDAVNFLNTAVATLAGYLLHLI